MIGGFDLVLEGPTHADDVDFAIRGIRSWWPNALVQSIEERDAHPVRTLRFPVRTATELLVYRDSESLASWTAEGATDSNQDAMIQLVVSASSLTVVVDRPNSELASITMDLLDALRRNRIVLPKAA